MTSETRPLSRSALRKVWSQLASSGTASPLIASRLRIGLDPFLDAYREEYLGVDGLGQGLKLILGQNGEGKTHLLFCIRELALRAGHPVTMLEPKSSAIGDSPFLFAQEALRRIETPRVDIYDEEGGDARLPTLLRAAVLQKRSELETKGLDADFLIPQWAEGLRDKELHPHGLADALADAVMAVLDEDPARLRAACTRMTFEGTKRTKRQEEVDGAKLLQSIPGLVKFLGFQPLVILLDEAETAVDKKGSKRKQEFLKFLRFLNDHIANSINDYSQAIVMIGCTDDFWPNQFNEYYALKTRLADPGKDDLSQRKGMTPKALARMNKIWVRETFLGDETTYILLGTALVDIALELYPELDRPKQLKNMEQVAKVSASDRIRKDIKRIFIKAICSEIENQVASGASRSLDATTARELLDAALHNIQQGDEED